MNARCDKLDKLEAMLLSIGTSTVHTHTQLMQQNQFCPKSHLIRLNDLWMGINVHNKLVSVHCALACLLWFNEF